MNLRALFLVALLGVLTAIGVGLSAFGWITVTGYASVVAGVLVVLARRARAQAVVPQDGTTCSCCTSTVFDPVQVI